MNHRCFEMKGAMKQNVILAGFMGTGKSTVGKILARRLNARFIDMDELIEKKAGKPISRIFADDGEAEFRRMERELARELAGETALVIAAGGGIVLNPDNIRDFSKTGMVICLHASETEIMRRISGSSGRPLLEKGDKFKRIFELMEKRRPLYESISSRIDTSGRTPEEVAGKILALISNKQCL